MSDLGYEWLEDGRFQCEVCIFATPHENRIKRHMVKSHGRAAYPEPPVLAEKWRMRQQAAEEVRVQTSVDEPSVDKSSGKGRGKGKGGSAEKIIEEVKASDTSKASQEVKDA